MSTTRVTTPLCQECHHPRSFHGGGKCKAMGCVSCTGFVAPAEPEPAIGAPDAQ